MLETTPESHDLPGALWTLGKVSQVSKALLGHVCGASTLRRLLRAAGLSWKKVKKLLSRADPAKRAEFLEHLRVLYDDMRSGRRTLIYIDESHVHQDVDLGFGWAERGVPFRKATASPGLYSKINWYGAYNFTDGSVFTWAYPVFNGENTVDFLSKLAEELRDKPRPTIVWDGAPAHRAKVATAAAKEFGFEVIRLPGYSPDFNPIEGLWKWLREEVTNGQYHKTLTNLFNACKKFFARVNLDPLRLIQRLWPKFDLINEEENLRQLT